MSKFNENSSYAFALRYCIDLLARREYSRKELQDKMINKQFCSTDIEQVLEHCQQKNWQSDRRFCENFINSRYHRSYGPLRITFELKQKGISELLYREIMEELDINWQESASALLHKKFPQYTRNSDIKLKQKAYRYMANRGFGGDTINQIFNLDEFD